MKQLLVASLLLLAGCASHRAEVLTDVPRAEDFPQEVSGTCHHIYRLLGLGDCVTGGWRVSEGGSRRDASFSCPTYDGLGTQTWNVTETDAKGVATVQVTHPTITCASTYAYAVTKL